MAWSCSNATEAQKQMCGGVKKFTNSCPPTKMIARYRKRGAHCFVCHPSAAATKLSHKKTNDDFRIKNCGGVKTGSESV